VDALEYATGILLFLAVIVPFIVVMYESRRRIECPNCGKRSVLEFKDRRKEIRRGEYTEYTMKIKGRRSRKVKFVLYRRTCKCKRCKHIWTFNDK
jgi:hypothetical protein